VNDETSEVQARQCVVGVPRDAEQTQALLATRPAGWEYLLFAGRLVQAQRALRLGWRNHVLELPRGPYRALAGDEVPNYLSGEFGRLGWIIEPMQRVLAAQEDAFGRPGESGEPDLIEHLADWIVGIYRQLMDWAADMRNVGVPEEFEPAVKLFAHAGDASIEQIRDFIDASARRLDELAVQLANQRPEEPAEPITVELTLTLTVDDALNEEALAMLGDAVARFAAQNPSSENVA
jgi:hypothetical protein